MSTVTDSGWTDYSTGGVVRHREIGKFRLVAASYVGDGFYDCWAETAQTCVASFPRLRAKAGMTMRDAERHCEQAARAAGIAVPDNSPPFTPAEREACERAAIEGRRKVVYLAHPVGAATTDGVRANLARAKRWLWWLRCHTTWSVCAPWVPAVEAVLDSGAPEHEHRERGLQDDLAVVERCDAIVLVGGRVSSGMALERDHAAKARLIVVDLTGQGEEPPGDALRSYQVVSALWEAWKRDEERRRG